MGNKFMEMAHEKLHNYISFRTFQEACCVVKERPQEYLKNLGDSAPRG